MVSTGVRPSSSGAPVIRLITIMVGMVSPMVESAEPSDRLTERCNWLRRAACNELRPSGDSTRMAIRIPPSAVGACSSSMP